MQDVGTGTRTAMAQIAAEELGIPLEHVTVSLGDSARGPYATLSAGSSTTPSMGPAVRAAAADARRQIVEIAAQRGTPDAPLAEIVGLLEDAQILGTGARGPNPTGMQVLTFGVQVAEVAVDIETGEVTVDRIAAIHDVGRVINPLGASSQIEGGIIQGIGHTLSEHRLHDPRTGQILTTSLDAYKLPTIADVPEIVSELVDEPDAQLTNLGSKGLGEPPIIPDRRGDRERDPRRDRRRGALAADLARGDAARAARGRGADEGEGWSSGGRLASSSTAARRCTAAPRSCRCCAAGSCTPRRSSTSAASCRAASTGRRSAPGRRSRSSNATPEIPAALREACRLAASPQLRNVGSLGGNLLQSTRCWYWRLKWPCRLHGGDECFARDGEHREHAIFANDFCASAHPSDVAAALLALGRDAAHEPARAARRRALPRPDRGRPADDDARAGRAAALGRGAAGRRVGLPEGDGAQALGVPARRRRRRAARRRDAGRARRRRPDPVAPRRERSTRRRRCRGTRTRSRSPERSSHGPSPTLARKS